MCRIFKMFYREGNLMKIIWTLLLMCFLVPVSYAKTQYVTDTLYITLRSGPGDEFKVLKALKTGTKLVVVEENDDGYSLVTTDSGEEGWARSKYLVNEPIAILKLIDLKSDMAVLKKEYDDLKQNSSASRKKIKELEKDRKRLESTSTNLANENAKMRKVSAKPLEMARQNDELKAANEAHESKIASLEVENAQYKDNTGRDWFLVGGGVLFFGIVVGLILPSIRWGKNKDWA